MPSITVDCSSGKEGLVLRGALAFTKEEHNLAEIPETATKVMVNVGSPHEAFKNHFLPVQGVGLGRLKFIVMSHLRVHPNAFLHYEALKKSEDANARRVAQMVDRITVGYEDKKVYYV